VTSPDARRVRLRTTWIAGAALVVTVAVAILALGGQNQNSVATASPAHSPAVAAASSGPTPAVLCHEEPGDLAPGLSKPSCPEAILAVQLAVAPVRLAIERIVIEPGPFFCDVLWPGAQTARPCFAVFVQPGQFMHAWVSFRDSPKVAAVMLGLDLPVAPQSPRPTRPPWMTTLAAVIVPPTGWVMP
jgi:hypothetical protein